MNKMLHPERCDISRPIAWKQLICTAINGNKGKICTKNNKQWALMTLCSLTLRIMIRIKLFKRKVKLRVLLTKTALKLFCLFLITISICRHKNTYNEMSSPLWN